MVNAHRGRLYLAQLNAITRALDLKIFAANKFKFAL
jgi:hypothetical protein